MIKTFLRALWPIFVRMKRSWKRKIRIPIRMDIYKEKETTRETETKLFIFFSYFSFERVCVFDFFLHRSQRHKMKIGMKPTFWAHTHQLWKNEMWTFHIYPLYLDHVFAPNAFNWIYSCSKPNCVDSFYPVIVFLYIWC